MSYSVDVAHSNNNVSIVISIINNYLFCHRFGCCEIIISDQGHEFVNQIQEELYQLIGTEH